MAACSGLFWPARFLMKIANWSFSKFPERFHQPGFLAVVNDKMNFYQYAGPFDWRVTYIIMTTLALMDETSVFRRYTADVKNILKEVIACHLGKRHTNIDIFIESLFYVSNSNDRLNLTYGVERCFEKVEVTPELLSKLHSQMKLRFNHPSI